MQEDSSRSSVRLTVLLNQSAIRTLKHAAVDRGMSTSSIVRTAVNDFLKSKTTADAKTLARTEK
jgi:hypothetical protein